MKEVKEVFNIFRLLNGSTWQSNVFIRGSKLNEKIVEVINKLKQKGLSERSISKKLKIGRNSIRRWKKSNSAISIIHLEKLFSLFSEEERKRLETDISLLAEEISTYQKKRWIKIPKNVTPELARILGRHAGDGCIISRTHLIKLVDRKSEVITEHVRDIEKVFGLKMKIKKGNGNFWECSANSQALSLILNRFFNVPVGRKHKIIAEPTIIRKSDLSIRKEFLRGVLQTDGSIWRDKKGKVHIEIEVTSKPLIESCKEILSLLGFSVKVRNRKRGCKSFRISISGSKAEKLVKILQI